MFRCAQCHRPISVIEAVSWRRLLVAMAASGGTDAPTPEDQIAFACPQCGLQFQVPRDGALALA